METKIETYKLDNGLTVLTKEVHTAPVTSVFLWYRVGSRNEPYGQSGLAHFLEHMLFKGTRRFAKGEISRLVGRTGGHQNAFTSYDYTAYFETVPSNHLDLALEIEADRMRNALLEEREVEQERTVILSEMDGNLNHPQVRLRDLVNAQSWLNHPYRRPVIGWREEVARLSPENLRAFYDAHYRPQNATLVVAGDFESGSLRERLNGLFGSLDTGGRPAAEPSFLPEAHQGERRVLLRDHGPASLLQINFPVPPAGDPDHYVLTVLNDVLVKGKTSRLYKALVDTGMATHVTAHLHEMINSGFWTFMAICQQGVDPVRVERLIFKELERAKKGLVSTRELERSVNQTRADLIFSKDSLTDQSMLLGFYQTVAGDWRLPDLFPERVAAVTPEQVQQIAIKYLVAENMTVGHFLPVDGGGTMTALPTGDAVAFKGNEPGRGSWPGNNAALPWLPGGLTRGLPELPEQPPQAAAGAAPAAVEAAPQASKSRRFVLSNGLTLLVQANRSNPTLALSGLVKAGIASEPSNLTGLAMVHAQMLDRGTARRSASQIAEDLEQRGAEIHYSVNHEEINIAGKALSEDLNMILGIVAESLTMPTFPEDEFGKVRRELLAHSQLARDNAQMQAWHGFNELAYPEDHPLRRDLISAEAGLKKIVRKDLVVHHRMWIRPENTILSLAGDVDPDQVHQLAEKLFQSWRTHDQLPEQTIDPMTPVASPKAVQTPLPGKNEAIVVLGHEGIHRKDPEYYQAYVANHLLGGGGLSSLLMRTVRDREGLTYSIYSMFKLAHGQRPWCAVLQVEPGKVERAVNMTLEEVRQLQDGRVSEQDLDDSREQLIGELSMSLETNAGIAYLNREVEYHELGADYLDVFPKAVQAVTFEKMVQAARKWFHPDRCLLSIAGPEVPAFWEKKA